MTAKRRPTMVDVAERAGVSLSTVSLTFSGAGPITPDTKAKVERAAAELGYMGPSPAAKSLRSGRTGIVGVVIPDKLVRSFRDPNTLRVMDGLAGDLGDMGLGVLLVPTPTGEDGERSLLETAGMDAAVVMRVRDHDDPALDMLRRRGIPAVVMEGPAPPAAASVSIDDEAATAELIRKLLELGHERIATVTLQWDVEHETRVVEPGSKRPVWTPTRNRLNAFKAAGIEPCVTVEAAASMVEEGIAAGHLALAHESKPTAVVCQSDLLAAGVIVAARELGMSVPQDVSVTGFDGLDLPWLAPQEITTMWQDAPAKGKLLAAEVRAVLAGEAPEPVEVHAEFRAGTTIAKPRRR